MAIPAEEVFSRIMTPEQRAEAQRKGQALIARHLTMRDLRKARDLTQMQLARTLGKNQASIAQLERRSDILLSTLRRYVEAVGGRLDLVVRFPDHEPVHLSGFADEERAERAPVAADCAPVEHVAACLQPTIPTPRAIAAAASATIRATIAPAGGTSSISPTASPKITAARSGSPAAKASA